MESILAIVGCITIMMGSWFLAVYCALDFLHSNNYLTPSFYKRFPGVRNWKKGTLDG